MTVDVVLAQFGPEAGVWEPAVSSVREYLPEARWSLYTDRAPAGRHPFARVHVVEDLPYRGGRHEHNRHNDLWKIRGVLNSAADVAIALDADMYAVGPAVDQLPELARIYGLCLPVNPRGTVTVDASMGRDGSAEVPAPLAYMHALNMSPVARGRWNREARCVLSQYVHIMEQAPCRGPLAMAQAVRFCGWSPLLLPPQWCVCAEDVGIPDPIMLHVGHERVRRFYRVSI